MTEPTRSARPRRGGRRPGWLLLTALLVLAIGASSALVFTNRVELLKLAVILALWAAVVASFASVIYRRQADADQAKVRDLKLVYDLQLDREISARREYELSVETQLRRELVAELKAQTADEVAGLRAELAALRANLEILFDADLSDRPALETDRSGFRGYGDWSPPPEQPPGRVTASRLDAEEPTQRDARTEESPIIDVPEEPAVPEYDWRTSASGGAHHLAADAPSGVSLGEDRPGRRRRAEESPWAPPAPPAPPTPTPPPRPTPPPEEVTRETQFPWLPGQAPAEPATPPEPAPPPPGVGTSTGPEWKPAPAEGLWIPAGSPGSNWQPEPSGTEYVGKRRAPEEPEEPRRGRHSAPSDDESGRAESRRPKHASPDDAQTGGQSVAELLARLQATPSGGGRRRRREE